MAVIFLDASGLNALPCGIFVSLMNDDGSTAAAGYLLVGGYLDQPVQGAVRYTASFTGTLAPTATQSFFGNATPGADTIVLVSTFSSSTLSTLGWGDAQRTNYPKGWANPDGTQIQSLISGSDALGAAIATLDNQTQTVRAGLRAWTAEGASLGSWVADFLGTYVLRYNDEDDETFRARAISLFGPRNTLEALANITKAFYAATLNERRLQRQPDLAYDTQGAYDVTGAYDVIVPAPIESSLTPTTGVWDLQSRPDLAAEYGITAGYFVIVVGFSNSTLNWFLDRTFVDNSAYLFDGGVVETSTTPPDVRLDALIRLVKAGGTAPVYQVVNTTG